MLRVLITGANRGVGLELTRLCLERGDRVFAGCRDPQRSAALESLVVAYPAQLTLLPLDVTDSKSLRDAGSLVRGQTEALDLLLNNAAIYADGENVSTFSAEHALNMLNVNAVAPMLVAQQFLSLLRAGGEPKIVNISSEAGSISEMEHYRGYYYYSSKSALNMFTRALAWDPETEGITVIALHPGWVRTDMGGEEAPLLPAESAAGILKVAAALLPEDNGKFLTWEGDVYPW